MNWLSISTISLVAIKALEKIDDMDVADVKQYLKKLIRDNMIVGMEIIKGK